MFIVESYGSAVLFCIITMLCWGSWANTQKLADKNWRFELFYWDYILGMFLFSIVLAFTLGSSGEAGRSFATDINQAESSNLLSAFIGGIIFNLANILLVAALNLAGMAVAFPVGIGIALILGVLLNYMLAPMGDFLLLILGVVMVMVAILFTAAAYRKATAGTKVSSKGIALSVVSGVLMGSFYPFVAKGISPDFSAPEAGMLTPYTAFVVMVLGALISNFLFNTILMKRPFAGNPVSYSDYFSGSRKSHLAGILGGLIWGIGTAFNIIASGKAGFAISYGLGQGATLIAAIWGVFIWKEFKNAPRITNILIACMFLFYVSGLLVIILSK
ncbi:MAG: GRP family sugar transporter [Bacteroidetes bacterium]|nr:GRP family sugar transporter [Bacteroidota bacterium]